MNNVYIDEYMNENTLKELFSGTDDEIEQQLFLIKLQTGMNLSDLPIMYKIKEKYPSFFLYKNDYDFVKPNILYNASTIFFTGGFNLKIMDNIHVDSVSFPYSFQFGICCHMNYKLSNSGSYNMTMDRYFASLEEAKEFSIEEDTKL